VGLGPSPVVRLEGALAHDDSATARGQRMRAAATSAPTQSLPGYTAASESNLAPRRLCEKPHLSRQIRPGSRLEPEAGRHLPCGEPRRIGSALLASCATGPSPRPSRATWPVQGRPPVSAGPSAAWRRGTLTPRWRQHVHAQTVDERVENGPPLGRSPHRRSEGAL
jgi:hypothetical protein